MGVDFVNHVEAILDDVPTPTLLESSFSGIQVPKRRCRVGRGGGWGGWSGYRCDPDGESGTTPFMLNSLATGKIESVFNGFKDRKWPLTSLKHFS